METVGSYCHRALVVVSLVATAACMPDIPEDEPPGEGPDAGGEARVQPVLDPAAETLPLPNDLALDGQGTLPELEGAGEESAEGEFLSWLDSLHGWLPETDIEIFFDGRLNEETVSSDAVRLFQFDGEDYETLEVASVEYRETTVEVSDAQGEIREVDGSVVTLEPGVPIERDREYGAVVTRELEGADGRSIVEPQPIFFAASREPLVDENGQKTIESIPDDETAQQLEEIRQLLQPVLAAADAEGTSRDQVAMAMRWSTIPDPQTIVDPETQTVPLPNTAALEEDGTFPAGSALDEVGDESAQGYFNAYLDRLHGWPPTTPITLPIAGEVDGETVTSEAVRLWAMGTDDVEAEQIALEEVTYDAASGTVTLMPEEPLPQRRRFVAFATDQVENSDGLSLKLPPALKMAIQPHDILDEEGGSTVSRIPDGQAESIAELREFMRPAATFLEESTDASPDELGAIWTWHTWMDTFAVFDPTTGEFPMPHEFVRRGENGSVSLPTDDLEGAQAAIVDELNRRFGFSTTAAGWIPFAGPVDTDTLDAESLQLVWLQPPVEVYEPARYELEYRSEWDQVTYTPTIPWYRDGSLEPNPDPALPQNVGVINDSLQGGNGHPVRPSPAFVFLRSPHSLTEENDAGETVSTVDQLDDETAQTLEEARETFGTLLQLGLGSGQLNAESREEIPIAWAFHPQNTPQYLQEFHAQALSKLTDPAANGVEPGCEQEDCVADDFEAGDLPNVGEVAWAGEFETVEFLADDGTMRDYENTESEPVGVSVFVPEKTGDCDRPADEGFEVAFVQHGLGGSRLQAGLALADELAAECVATVAMDLPSHGGRTPGTDSLHPDVTPEDSGTMFFTADLVGSLNRMIQGIVDMAVLAEIVQAGGLETAIDEDPSTSWFAYEQGDESPIGFIGHSLGGFSGFPLVSIDPNFSVGSFAGIGAKLTRILTEGALGSQLGDALPGEEGSFERFQATSLAQWLAEIVDPFAYAPYIGDSPAYTPKFPLERMTYDTGNDEFQTGSGLEANEVLLQMTENEDGEDPVVPNATTEMLAEATGVSLDESTFTGSHSLLFESSDEAACMRQQAAVWVASELTDGEAMLVEPPCE